MKKILFIVIFLGITQNVMSQKDALYLFIEKPFFRYNTIKRITTGFIIKSKDNRFVCNYYMFGVINYQGWDEKGEDIYLNLEQLREKIDINTINYKIINDFKKNKKWWKVHNQLSLYKKIYLVQKIKNKDSNLNDYYTIPLIYEGTRKNIIPTDFSFRRDKK